ncbi:MAG: hypothetical protein A4E58_02844 [Syntrophorhabdus sp. PtaB.Bin006]|nr:MAG: hypothetical protein A4E58_02844 [Syntrophorhabdus sp. PtaB.Bin006]
MGFITLFEEEGQQGAGEWTEEKMFIENAGQGCTLDISMPLSYC